MTIMKREGFYVLLLSCVLFISICCHDMESSLEVPIYYGAFQVENCSIKKGIICIKYIVEEQYQSTAVLSYYDNKLIGKGWIPFIEDYYSKDDREWTNCGMEGRCLTAYWVNPEKTKRILVKLIQPNKINDYNNLSDLNANIKQTVFYEERRYYELPPLPK